MPTKRLSPRVLKGFAFDLPDLIMLRAWADYHDVHMVIELDHCVETEEYEEVLAFYAPCGSLRRWIMWRGRRDIVVQPLIGRPRRFATVNQAMDGLIPARS
jgi:hypothetical protein